MSLAISVVTIIDISIWKSGQTFPVALVCLVPLPLIGLWEESTIHDTHIYTSLGTRPSKNQKGGSGKLAGVEVYTAPGMKAHFQLAFD